MEPTEFGWASLEVALSAAPKKTFNHVAVRSLWIGIGLTVLAVPLHLVLYSIHFSVFWMSIIASFALTATLYGLRSGVHAWNHASRGRATNRGTAMVGIVLCTAVALAVIGLTVANYAQSAPSL